MLYWDKACYGRALGLAGLVCAAYAPAAQIGGLQGRTVLGEPFHGYVIVTAPEGIELTNQCVKVLATDGLPGLPGAKPRVNRYGSKWRIDIDARPVNEPAVAFALQLHCGAFSLSREYSVLFDLPTADQIAPPEVAERHPLRVQAKAAADEKPAVVRKKRPARVAARARAADAPARHSRPARTESRLATAPALPTLRPQDNKPSVTVTSRPPGTLADPQLAAREQQLMELAADQSARLREVQYRVEQLQKRLDALERQLAHSPQRASAPAAPVASTPPQTVTERLAAETPKAAPQEEAAGWWSTPTFWWLMAGVAGLAGLAAALMRTRRRSRYAFEPTQALSTILGPVPAMEDRGAPMPDLEVLHPNRLADEIQLLVSHGMADHALLILKDELKRNPDDLDLWLMLLDIYRRQHRRKDFVQEAEQFRSLAREEPAAWSRVREMAKEVAPDDPLFMD